jgi:hypothetical protein
VGIEDTSCHNASFKSSVAQGLVLSLRYPYRKKSYGFKSGEKVTIQKFHHELEKICFRAVFPNVSFRKSSSIPAV